MPNPDYIEAQDEMTWEERGMLVDWLINIHNKFRLIPETLFLAVNLMDRLLSLRFVALSKLQLVGVTALFTAAKYEEVLVPSVTNFVYVCHQAVEESDMFAAERYLLRTLNFDLSYPNPMNFLRRISKADDYDIQTRTVAKYLIEIATVDYRLMSHPPSALAAAALWLAREVLERGEWGPTLVHYSGYTVPELLTTAEVMLDYVLRPPMHPSLYRKYASKKFMKASVYVQSWAADLFPTQAQQYLEDTVPPSTSSDPNAAVGAPRRGAKGRLIPEEPLVNLFSFYDMERPTAEQVQEIFGITEALQSANHSPTSAPSRTPSSALSGSARSDSPDLPPLPSRPLVGRNRVRATAARAPAVRTNSTTSIANSANSANSVNSANTAHITRAAAVKRPPRTTASGGASTASSRTNGPIASRAQGKAEGEEDFEEEDI